ncbi:MAG: sugar ABC transporter permease [Chloroflexi bacterium]|nr:sugar ABC transporter permease [Chloroflexota bacterium]
MRQSRALPYILISPSLALILAFVFYPTLYGFQLSFMRMIPLTGEFEFAGLENYSALLGARELWESARVTLFFGVQYVAVVIILGFALALIMNRKPRAMGLYMTLIFVPWVLSDVVASIIWRILFNQQIGIIELTMRNFPFWPKLGLITTPQGALWVMVLLGLWRGLPFAMLLLLAGLQTISRELIEAARIDGASSWRAFFSVTLPLMRSQALVLLLLASIGAVNAAATFLAVTQGGPGRYTEVLGLFLYRTGFQFFRIDHGSTIAVMMFLINLSLTLVYLRAFRSEYRL